MDGDNVTDDSVTVAAGVIVSDALPVADPEVAVIVAVVFDVTDVVLIVIGVDVEPAEIVTDVCVGVALPLLLEIVKVAFAFRLLAILTVPDDALPPVTGDVSVTVTATGLIVSV